MLSEYQDILPQAIDKNPHLADIIQKHKELSETVNEVESGREYMDQVELEDLKKEKLRLKDEAYGIVSQFKQNS